MTTPDAAERPTADVLIALGTNLGNRAENLQSALAALHEFVDIDARSRVYNTEPVGLRDQPDFWNMVVRGRTLLEPLDLLRALKRIELQLGRNAAPRNAPRVIDLDLLAFDQRILSTDEITLPHPRMHERSFVLYPLQEVAPDFRHPVSGLSAGELIERLVEPTRATVVEGVGNCFDGDDVERLRWRRRRR